MVQKKDEPPGLQHRRNQVLGATTYDMEDCGVDARLKSKEDEAKEGCRMVGRSRKGTIPVDGDVARGADIQLMGIGREGITPTYKEAVEGALGSGVEPCRGFGKLALCKRQVRTWNEDRKKEVGVPKREWGSWIRLDATNKGVTILNKTGVAVPPDGVEKVGEICVFAVRDAEEDTGRAGNAVFAGLACDAKLEAVRALRRQPLVSTVTWSGSGLGGIRGNTKPSGVERVDAEGVGGEGTGGTEQDGLKWDHEGKDDGEDGEGGSIRKDNRKGGGGAEDRMEKGVRGKRGSVVKAKETVAAAKGGRGGCVKKGDGLVLNEAGNEPQRRTHHQARHAGEEEKDEGNIEKFPPQPKTRTPLQEEGARKGAEEDVKQPRTRGGLENTSGKAAVRVRRKQGRRWVHTEAEKDDSMEECCGKEQEVEEWSLRPQCWEKHGDQTPMRRFDPREVPKARGGNIRICETMKTCWTGDSPEL
ncbi:hypothetical protein C8R44DRAFT_730285 [Mycena epipterygia]|nr:hypothetical protein C8R44DRAFT_730285 [Mycena epipterygia]